MSSKIIDCRLCPVCKGKGYMRVSYIVLDLKGKPKGEEFLGGEDSTAEAERHAMMEPCPTCGFRGNIEPADLAMYAMGKVNGSRHEIGDQLPCRDATMVWVGTGWHRFQNPYYLMYVKKDPSSIMNLPQGDRP